MNAARNFMRREDYQPPQTPVDSPFWWFGMSWLKCGRLSHGTAAHKSTICVLNALANFK
jgi:hypothetical protein